MGSKLDGCITLIPTIHELSEGNSVELYLKQMIKEDCLMPFCILDDSKKPVYEKNKRYLQHVKDSFDEEIAIYHFGPPEQEVFYDALMDEGVPRECIEMLETVPSYGAARNKGFLSAKSIGAERIFFFDDDTRPCCNLFRRHLKIIGTRQGLKKIAAVSGPYIGARGIDLAFLKTHEDKIGFLKAIDHHGLSSLNFLQEGGIPIEAPDEGAEEFELIAVKNIRGGNCLVDSVYQYVICPTIKQAPGLDDTFVARTMLKEGYAVVKSPVPVIHEHLAVKKTGGSILTYTESWAKALAFELLHAGENRKTADKRVLRYGKELYALENKYCKQSGEKLMDEGYRRSFISEITDGLRDFKKLRKAWKRIMEIGASIEREPI